MKKSISKNQPTIKHLRMACRHINEMKKEGVTENHRIRLLELFADIYAKLKKGGSASPHHVDQVPLSLWSVAAKNWRKKNPKLKPGSNLRVEHGTPRRGFARKVLELYDKKKLNKATMDELVNKYWKLAVITHKEDLRLNEIGRSKIFESPKARWKIAKINF